MNKKFKTVDEYFASLQPKSRKILTSVRKVIKIAAPQAEEVISYNIPAFKLKGMLVWYAMFKEHVSLFPKKVAINHFKKELSEYDVSKGTIKFPINKPIPIKLIEKIVMFRIKENTEKM